MVWTAQGASAQVLSAKAVQEITRRVIQQANQAYSIMSLVRRFQLLFSRAGQEQLRQPRQFRLGAGSAWSFPESGCVSGISPGICADYCQLLSRTCPFIVSGWGLVTKRNNEQTVKIDTYILNSHFAKCRADFFIFAIAEAGG